MSGDVVWFRPAAEKGSNAPPRALNRRHCKKCDVKWYGDAECWCCGRRVR